MKCAGADAGVGAGADAVRSVQCAVGSLLPPTGEDLTVEIQFSLTRPSGLGQSYS